MKTSKDIRVLIVEDSEVMRNLEASMLHRDFEVHLARDGEDAINAFKNNRPHITFLDIELPKVSGIKVLQQILMVDKDAYVVMLSGQAFKETIHDCMSKGAKGFVGKPFTKNSLVGYIEKAISHRFGNEESTRLMTHLISDKKL